MTIYDRDGMRVDIECNSVTIYSEQNPEITMSMGDLLGLVSAVNSRMGVGDRDYEV